MRGGDLPSLFCSGADQAFLKIIFKSAAVRDFLKSKGIYKCILSRCIKIYLVGYKYIFLKENYLIQINMVNL